ncbi:hypothetical protein J8281_05375 [Aquimarina sp. U1-2]|uniref:hypothetical protein n=1 Tax=Aquimarina sp. U1-2 TaxID=2823141 RepID=UPI001AED088D|nr:hypothetical protein [Aquimarina sp. U1-2]MBP2831614.1 hypothetical protein [Aquimarina sp. U1-2]
MKNLVIIIVLFQSFQLIYAQGEFVTTKKYIVTTEISDRGQDYPAYHVSLVRADNSSDIISTLTIADTELFEDIFITTLENPGLEGISEVIKMEVEYLACCAHVASYYFMIDHDNNIVELPEVKNVYCEDSDTDFQYIFPNQEYGVAGNILKTQTFYENKSDIKYVNLKQSHAWNDNTISFSKNTAITSY